MADITTTPQRGPTLETLRDAPLHHQVDQLDLASFEGPAGPQHAWTTQDVQQQEPQWSGAAESSWWRRLFGLGPSRAALAAARLDEEAWRSERDRKLKVTQPLADPLSIAVVSLKGGAGKTPIARALGACLSATRGGGTTVVDLDTGGTLGVRSRCHGGHLGQLVAGLEHLESTNALLSEVTRTMSQQIDSHERVLPGDPNPATPMTRAEFHRVHGVLERYFDVMVFDTGNSDLAEVWQAAVEGANIVVVPTKWRQDHIATIVTMLRRMNQRGHAPEGRTVIVGTNGVGEADPEARAMAYEMLSDFPIVEIPIDPGLDAPVISWSELLPGTRAAFEALGATTIELAKEQPNG